MKADQDNKKLDGLISQAIGREVSEFDFGTWKDDHRTETEIFKSKKLRKLLLNFKQIYSIDAKSSYKSRTCFSSGKQDFNRST